MGYPSLKAGVAMVALGLGGIISMPLAAFLVTTLDPRHIFIGGIFTFSASFFLLMGFNLNVTFWDVFLPLSLQGLALGLAFVPLTVLAVVGIPNERMGNATGLFNMMRNIGGGVGISIVETMLTRMGQQHTNLLVANVDQTSPSAVSLIRGLKGLYVGSGPVLADQQAYATLFGLVERQAAMVALVRVFQYMTVMVLALIPLIFLTKRPHKGESSPPNGP